MVSFFITFLIQVLGYIYIQANRYVDDKSLFIFFFPHNDIWLVMLNRCWGFYFRAPPNFYLFDRVEFWDRLSTFFFFFWYNVQVNNISDFIVL